MIGEFHSVSLPKLNAKTRAWTHVQTTWKVDFDQTATQTLSIASRDDWRNLIILAQRQWKTFDDLLPLRILKSFHDFGVFYQKHSDSITLGNVSH